MKKYKKIKLTQGKFAIVDEQDYPLLSRHNWSLNNGNPCKNFSRHQILMSHLIVPITRGGNTKRIYFKNHNPLDLRKENMEMRAHAEHSAGQLPRIKTSKYKGVCWAKRDKLWECTISKRYKGKRKKYFLGYFRSERKAAEVYNGKAYELFGEYAYQNKI